MLFIRQKCVVTEEDFDQVIISILSNTCHVIVSCLKLSSIIVITDSIIYEIIKSLVLPTHIIIMSKESSSRNVKIEIVVE